MLNVLNELVSTCIKVQAYECRQTPRIFNQPYFMYTLAYGNPVIIGPICDERKLKS